VAYRFRPSKCRYQPFQLRGVSLASLLVAPQRFVVHFTPTFVMLAR
jgi:hypothetical protein